MQRIACWFMFATFCLSTAACMDQGHHDRAVVEVDAARREAARDARLVALEREHAFLMQQMALLSSMTNSRAPQDAGKEEERDKRLADVSAQVSAIGKTITAWRDEERPQAIDPDARRAAEQGSAEERAAAVRKVQAMIDAGRIKLTMRKGRIQLAQVRPIDATDPYEVPEPKSVPTAPPRIKIPKRAVDRLGF